ncbi:MAG: DNA polymerase I [Candidatus Ryanbacteria bacterium CG10_big_fil_rev_8_21_14_0_10_43_42]|uniref:DNA polymerase I n=1 Tax=Candidatus Ryanbacteria bacterium CG10_big_fil_rev_8_21_14_0_10_43_42 TaxID=1974864 RepID=A0A2M8KWD7_9BACT|nr:MAG: DNA polymerase I [Candidatus Ryanbacteria bacterium CG10_big_fil_rev_8_21_14_0_10_43_42]
MVSSQKIEQPRKLLILLDTHALIYRAFHALPPLTSPAGKPVGAVYGVANIVLKMLKEYKPDYIAAAFDRAEPTFRHDAYDGYKAQREEAPDDLIAQFGTTRELMDAFHISTYDVPGFEADDMIGTIVTRVLKDTDDVDILIISGDADLLQLADEDRVRIYRQGNKNVSDTTLNAAGVREKYGFGPEHIADYKGLKGDSSDNIKGVPGIGDKTATALIMEFGSIENIYKALSRKDAYPALFKPRVVRALEEYKEDAFFSRDLARLHTEAPISFDLEKTYCPRFDTEHAYTFLEQQGFRSLLARLPNENGKKEEVLEDKSTKHNVHQCTKDTEEMFIKSVSNMPIVGWLPDEDRTGVLIGDKKMIWHISAKECFRMKKMIRDLFSDAAKKHIAHEAKDLIHILHAAGVDYVAFAHDTGIAAWVLDPIERDLTINALADMYLGVELKAYEEGVLYLEDITKKQEQNLIADKVDNVFYTIELPLIPVLARMEETGIALDTKELAVFSRRLEKRITEREKTIYALAGEEFNINSPKQLSEILFDTIGIMPERMKKTEGGARSTRASELVKMKDMHPIIDEILSYREEAKLKSTYVDVLPVLVHKDTGRIHATFNQTGTVTGRLSSQDPNLQNIPIRTPLGQEIRRSFVASPGYVFIACDYSQIELRLVASLSGDEKMITAFKNGEDIHTRTAAAVHAVSLKEVTSSMRRAAKVINFGILYGMGAVSLAENLGITRKEADVFIKAYFAEFPRIKEYMNELKEQAEEEGYVETLFGRRRYFRNMASLGWQARREAERMAINAPIQGSEADIMKIAMIQIAEKLKKEQSNNTVRLLIQVHDELLFEIKEDLADHYAKKIASIMESVCTLAVPLTVDSKRGKNWYELSV